jgi:hypothetical protein
MVEPHASMLMLETAAAWWRGEDAQAAWDVVVDRDGWRFLAEATAYRGDLHWPGESPSRAWWESVRDMPDMRDEVMPWVHAARSGARVALGALAVIEADMSSVSQEELGRLIRPLMEWQAHRTAPSLTFGRGPRQRPLATQNNQGKFVLRPGTITESESLVDTLVHKALTAING